MNVADTTEAHKLLEALRLGQAQMMTFELISVGPLWPLGLLFGGASEIPTETCRPRRLVDAA